MKITEILLHPLGDRKTKRKPAKHLWKLDKLNMNFQIRVAKQRLVESIIESYQQLTGRTWKEMTYPEKEALEKLRAQ